MIYRTLAFILLTLGYTIAHAQIIPQPLQTENKQGSFTLSKDTTVHAIHFPEKAQQLAKTLSLKTTQTRPETNAIVFKKADKPNTLGKEGYQLDIGKKYIVIRANTPTGAFYGTQSLRQLLPATTFTHTPAFNGTSIPAVSITDTPRFPWRGFMLDSCRHIQSIERIKQYLDLMALYKLNVFHWHLTEDEAWRMEIKKYPKLTSIGAYPGAKDKNEELNGFYTQDQMREIVAYAHARHIKVVPEFDIPGHTNALLMAYPEYLCNDAKPLAMGEPGMRAFSSKAGRRAICAGKHAQTIPMIMDIFAEMQTIFPDAIFHIGGDERPKEIWENCEHCQKQIKKLGLKNAHHLQNWFLNEISERLRKKGIRTIAWAEHLKGGIPKNQIVQAWRTPNELPDAVKAGHQVVDSLHTKIYLDYPAHSTDLNKHAEWMRNMRVSTKSIYHYNPVPENLTPAQQKLVIGVEAPVWTETILNDRLDLKVFPRLLAVAEIAWTDGKKKNWPSFQKRFTKHKQILNTLGIQYDQHDKIK